MTLPDDWLFESLRLLAQGAVAFIVARLAVRWALSRYKQEKLWERRLAAYSDIIVALSEMRRVNRLWYDDLICRRERDEDFSRQQEERYKAARLRLEETLAVGMILWACQ